MTRIIYVICLSVLMPVCTFAADNYQVEPKLDPISIYRTDALRKKAALESIMQIQLELLKFAKIDPNATAKSRLPRARCIEVFAENFCDLLKGTFQ